MANPHEVELRDTFYWLGEINKASAVMVVETKIVPESLGAKIADAIADVINAARLPGAARPGDYLQVEQLLIAIGGPDVTRVHSGRSRQDISATRARLILREGLLEVCTSLDTVRATLLSMAQRRPNAIMPAYTWGVQAQPISFGHYLLAYYAAFTRLRDRLEETYARLNQSPLGSAALGTSSFPVDRVRLAELLGFDSVLENSLDANQIAPVDSGADIAALASSAALTIGMLVADITVQYSHGKPWILLTQGELTGISSIMPQKRNPTGLVFLRARASTLIGQAQSYVLLAHNVPAGMSDYKPSNQQGNQPVSVLQDTTSLLEDFDSLLNTLAFDDERALDEVDSDYSTTTELADMLQRESGVPFRVGHHFSSELVDYGRANNLRPSEIDYIEAKRIYAQTAHLFNLDASLPLDEASFKRSLSAENMVRESKGLGGPQPEEISRMLEQAGQRLRQDDQWLFGVRKRLADSSQALDASFAALLGR